MRYDERYPAPDPRLVEQLNAKTEEVKPASRRPDLRLVHSVRASSHEATNRLQEAYADEDSQEPSSNPELSQSGTFRLKKDAQGQVIGAERVDDVSELVTQRMEQSIQKSQGLMTRYTEAMMEVSRADKGIEEAKAQLRWLSNQELREDILLAQAKALHARIDDLTAWRQGQMGIVEVLNTEVQANNQGYEELKQKRTIHELHAASKKEEGRREQAYQEALRALRRHEATLVQQEHASDALAEQLAQAMTRAQGFARPQLATQRQKPGLFRRIVKSFSREAPQQVPVESLDAQQANEAVRQVLALTAENNRQLDATREQMSALQQRMQTLQAESAAQTAGSQLAA